MKTEFERISEIMYTLLEHQPVIDVPYEKINDIAVALVKEGYGKTSEYKAEIERLNSNNGFLQCVISHSKDMMDEAVKEAQIDVLTELKKKYGFYICRSWCRATKCPPGPNGDKPKIPSMIEAQKYIIGKFARELIAFARKEEEDFGEDGISSNFIKEFVENFVRKYNL